jgi:hypothetical protein
MYHKIYLTVITILVVILSLSVYNSINLSNEIQRNYQLLDNSYASEKQITLADGKEWKACKIGIREIELIMSRSGISSNYTISKDNKCPEISQDYSTSKKEYITYLQNNPGWGVFDSQNIYPDMIPPDLPETSNSSKSN